VIFCRKDETWVVRDLHSANKTYLNNDVITEALLKHDDCIQVGDYKIEVDLDTGIDKLAYLEDTNTPVTRGPQIITRVLTDEEAPAVRIPIQRANQLIEILTNTIAACNTAEILNVLIDNLLKQFHAGCVWCALQYDSKLEEAEEAGRTDEGRSFNLRSDFMKKMAMKACNKQQFFLISNVKHEFEKQKARSVLIAPIIGHDNSLGILCIQNKSDRPLYTLSDLDYLLLVSINLGIILDNF
jgi:hypothetical protein